LLGIGGHKQLVEARGAARARVHPGNHRLAANGSQWFARQAFRFETRRNNAQYLAHHAVLTDYARMRTIGKPRNFSAGNPSVDCVLLKFMGKEAATARISNRHASEGLFVLFLK